MKVFDEEVKKTIEHTKRICDLKTLLLNIKKKGSVLVGLESSDNFCGCCKEGDQQSVCNCRR